MSRLYALVIFMCTLQCYAMENQMMHSNETLPLKKRKIMNVHEISVPDIIEIIYMAIELKDVHRAEWWYARLNKKMYIDWQFLNDQQIKAFADINYDMYCKIDDLQPPDIKKFPPKPHQNTYGDQALHWTRQAVELDTDTTLVWRAGLDDTHANKPIPSPQLLKKHRLEQLDKISKDTNS